MGGSHLLAERIRDHGHTFPPAERAVAEYLGALPVADLAFVSTQSLAAATGRSEATVTRTARRLGFTGLPELKRLATREHAASTSYRARLTERLEAIVDPVDNLDDIVHSAQEAIAETGTLINPRQLRIATGLLASARTIWCVAVGTAGFAVTPAASRVHCCV